MTLEGNEEAHTRISRIASGFEQLYEINDIFLVI
jgi:hypothetical protein